MKLSQDALTIVTTEMSNQFLTFCQSNDLPFECASDLLGRDDLTEEQFGWLLSFITIWDALTD